MKSTSATTLEEEPGLFALDNWYSRIKTYGSGGRSFDCTFCMASMMEFGEAASIAECCWAAISEQNPAISPPIVSQCVLPCKVIVS